MLRAVNIPTRNITRWGYALAAVPARTAVEPRGFLVVRDAWAMVTPYRVTEIVLPLSAPGADTVMRLVEAFFTT